VFCLLGLVLVQCWNAAFAQALPQITVNGQVVGDTATVYGTGATITMSGYTGGHIFYTTNGEPPTVSSAEYSSALTFTNSFHLRAIAYDSAFAQSSSRDVQVTLAPLYILRLSGARKYMEYSLDGSPYQAVTGPSLNVGSNQLVSLRAVPGDGWLFDRWQGHHPSASQTNTFHMDRTHEVHLSMYRNTAPTFLVSGDGEVVVTPPPPYYWDDNPIQVTAVPHAGSFFAGWNLPQASPSAISFNQAPDGPGSQAYFSPLLAGTHAISVRVDGLGIVVEPSRYFAVDGDTVKITVQPAVGWSVTNFTGDVTAPGTTQANPYGKSISVTMNSDKSVIAHVNKIATWNASFPPNFAVGAPLIAPNGLVIYGASEFDVDGPAYILAYDQDGFETWEANTYSTKGHVIVGGAIAPDGTILEWVNTLGAPGEVNAYSSEDGHFLWRIVPPGVSTSVAVSDQGIYVCSPNSGRALRRYSLAGELINSVNTGAFNDYWGVILDPNSDPDTTGQDIISYTPTLTQRWSKPNPTYSGGGPAQAIYTDAAGDVITADLKAFTYATGAPLWTAPYTSGVFSSLGTNRVFIADSGAGGALSALDLATGQKLWTVNEPYPTALGGSVAAADGSVFTIGPLRKVSATGEIIWEALVAAASSPILTPSGRMYFGRSAADVAVGPAPSGFPMPRGDWMSSGKAYTGAIAYLNQLSITRSGQDFRVRFTPVTSAPLTLQWSDDLVNWNLEKSFTGPLDYTITAPTATHRFYRVIQ
jgi:hypothetical protein